MTQVWTPLTGIWYFRSKPCPLCIRFRGLNSTYWNLVFQVDSIPPITDTLDAFELHLLESGISGTCPPVIACVILYSLNSTYWNLVFQEAIPFFYRISSTCLNSTYWNLVFQVAISVWTTPNCEFELHLLESGISGDSACVESPDIFLFKLHLLESGISGSYPLRFDLHDYRLNSTYWNLVFQAVLVG